MKISHKMSRMFKFCFVLISANHEQFSLLVIQFSLCFSHLNSNYFSVDYLYKSMFEQ